MICWCIIISIGSVYGFPATWVQKVPANTHLNVDNSLDAYDADFSDLDIYFKGNIASDKKKNYTNEIIPFSTDFSDTGIPSAKNSTEEESKVSTSPTSSRIDPVNDISNKNVNDTRLPRQDVNDSGEFSEDKASQEEDSSEEEGGNMITGLLSAFLSGLSRPDGSIDLEAIIGLLGGLSTQNPDGTYDFTGLTDILRSFLGGGPEGGGSDIGAFAGGILGAVIKGVASPPGPKGAGILTGKILTGILPALSGPVPPENGMMGSGKPTKSPPLDSGAFLTGFLKTALGSGGGNGTMAGGGGSKYTLFKLIFSAITGVFSAASSLSSKSDWN